MFDEVREKISFAGDVSSLVIRSKRLNSSFLKSGLNVNNAKNSQKMIQIYQELIGKFLKLHPDVDKSVFEENFNNNAEFLEFLNEYLKELEKDDEEKKEEKNKNKKFDSAKISLILKQMTDYLNLIYEQTYIEIVEKQYKLISANIKEKQEQLLKLKETYKIDGEGLKKVEENFEKEKDNSTKIKRLNIFEIINDFIDNNPKPRELNLDFLKEMDVFNPLEKTRYRIAPEKFHGKFENNLKKAPASRPLSVEKEEKIKFDQQMAMKKDEPEIAKTFHR